MKGAWLRSENLGRLHRSARIIRRRLISSDNHSCSHRPPPSHQSATEMNNRRSSPWPEARTTIVSSAAVEFKVDYERTKHLARGTAIHSDDFSAGGHMWRINCYPRGMMDKYPTFSGMSMKVELMSKPQSASSATAIIQAFLMTEGAPNSKLSSLESLNHRKMFQPKESFTHVFQSSIDFGWVAFLEESRILYYLTDGQITVVFSIMVLQHRSTIIPALPSDMGEHLGALLDSTDGADVSFEVDGETFYAHRAVLAARSPVFRAELLGSMSKASTSSSITLHDIAPDITPTAFRIMLRFMYTDAFPGDDELGDSSTEMFKHLLAAADRYALGRLKIICVQKLWDNVSVDTVGDILACAEIYNCPELKSKCIRFVVAEENFKKAVLTKSFMQFGLKFPSIIDEVQERVGAK